MNRVTDILDCLVEKELLSWIENNSKAKRKAIQEEAFRVGKTVDQLVQEDIRDGGYLVPEGDLPVETCLKGWELFKKEHPEFVTSVLEMQTELTDGDVVGHPDFIHSDGITDLKCSTGIRPKNWTQTAKYGQMKFGIPKFIAILRLDKSQVKYEYVKIEDQDFIKYEIEVFKAYYVAFKHAMNTREQLRQQLEKEMLL